MKHQFAFYIPDIRSGEFELTDKQLVHRIVHVLRVRVGDVCIFFNRNVHTIGTITVISKRSITVKSTVLVTNSIWQPPITFFLPLLKRENLEQAVYGLTELGVTEIYLTRTEKSLTIISEKQFQRLEKIIIAAAEQSKNFAFPTLKMPIEFIEAIKQLPEHSIFFDPEGQSAESVLNVLKENKNQPIGLLIGPEGDLTKQERDLLRQRKVLFCSLTPTVLRSYQAAIVGVGIIRSLL